MVLPIEQKDVAIDVSQPAPDPMDQFAELDAHNSTCHGEARRNYALTVSRELNRFGRL
jgi:hypothetical protein